MKRTDGGLAVVFFQGIGASKYQIDRYSDLPAFDFLKKCRMQGDLPEIVYDFGWNPLYWINALIGWIIRVAKHIPKQRNYAIRFWCMSIGGRADVEAMRRRHDEACMTGDEPAVLFGVSRGALVTFLYTANAYGLFKHDAGPIRLVVLEGCPASIPDVLRRRFGRFTQPITWILNKFTRYQSDTAAANSPLSLLDQFPKSVPVAIVTSKGDDVVSYQSSCLLSEGLRSVGHANVHLLVLEKAGHDTYAEGEDGVRYQTFISHLRKKYNC